MLAIKKLCTQHADFNDSVKIEFVGSVNAAFKNFVVQDSVLAAHVTFMNQLPHIELLKLYESTDVLLLVLAHAAHAAGNIPGKLFEYLASGNEIIGVGASDGDSALILKNAGAGCVHEPNDQIGLETALLKSFTNWKSGTKPDSKTLTNYSRRVLTDKLTTLLEALG
jgi:hypothetical protein